MNFVKKGTDVRSILAQTNFSIFKTFLEFEMQNNKLIFGINF